jgi:hypothetical protein
MKHQARQASGGEHVQGHELAACSIAARAWGVGGAPFAAICMYLAENMRTAKKRTHPL